MTEPRTWPTIAADDRDQAAENLNAAAITLERIAEKLPAEHAKEILQADLCVQKSLRLLEKHGAKTTVPQLLRP